MKDPQSSLFFNTLEERISLARRRYFDEGLLPSGVVDSSVFESWTRCQRRGIEPTTKTEFNEVTQSRIALAQQRNHQLLLAWSSQVAELEKTLAGTSCSAILTDATGIVIACIGKNDDRDGITRHAHRIGVNLSEEAVGTTAPGLALKAGKTITVKGGEHFSNHIGHMYCAAAPIKNIHNNIAGVLNIAREGSPFTFQASALVSLYAASIENSYLASDATDQIVIALQLNPSLLDTPYVGLMGCSDAGDVLWQNQVAEQLIGHNNNIWQDDGPLNIKHIFGSSLDTLILAAPSFPLAVQLSSGLRIWFKLTRRPCGPIPTNRLQPMATTRSSMASSLSTTNPPALIEQTTTVPSVPTQNASAKPDTETTLSSLKECDADIIVNTVKKFDGNISKAAKVLKVSRGLIYRRLALQKKMPG